MALGGDVHTFTIGIPGGRLLGRLGGNRLVRASDRAEAIVTIMLFLFAVAGIPVVATVGMSTQRHQAAMYASQAGSLHSTTARVTASSSVWPLYGSKDAFDAPITWEVNGLPRVASTRSAHELTPGDQIPISVDGTGNLSGRPVSTDHSVMDGVLVGLFMWTAVVGFGVLCLRVLIWRLDRHRNAQWERELEALSEDGGRADHQS